MSAFWKMFDEKLGFEEWYGEVADTAELKESRLQMVSMLTELVPGSEKWLQGWMDVADRPDRHLLLALLLSLRVHDFDGNTPMAIAFDPEDITIHFLENKQFQEFLLTKPPRDAITFSWDVWDDLASCFHYPGNHHERLVSMLHQFYDDGKYLEYSGATFGFIRGKKLDLYPFPKDWPSLFEQARYEVRKMTAREKATIDLPGDIKRYVDLLGVVAVERELLKYKAPDPDSIRPHDF